MASLEAWEYLRKLNRERWKAYFDDIALENVIDDPIIKRLLQLKYSSSGQKGEQNPILDNLKKSIPVAITWAAVGSA
jgi:hypothetical protein